MILNVHNIYLKGFGQTYTVRGYMSMFSKKNPHESIEKEKLVIITILAGNVMVTTINSAHGYVIDLAFGHLL